MRRPLVTLALLVMPSAVAFGAQPYLVKDIDPVAQNGGSSPDQFVRVGNVVVFAATTIREGREPWVSDGTPAGTYRLLDACPDECSGDFSPLAVTPGGLFFATRDDHLEPTRRFVPSLWVTQGTPATTFRLAEGVWSREGVWLASQGILYFVGTDEQTQKSELWRSDGTAAGTYQVAQVHPGLGSEIADLVVFKGRLFFSGNDALWTSDGTAAGTRMVKNTNPTTNPSAAHGRLRHLVAASNALYFQAPSPAGWELWRSDGTAKGTRMVADLTRGPESPFIGDIVAVGHRVYMEARVDDKGQELWVSDGTKAGTKRLTNFLAEQPFSPHPIGPNVRALAGSTVVGTKLFFIATNLQQGRQVWVTNGTAQGTVPVTAFCPGTCVGVLSLWPAQGNRLFFTGSDGQLGVELWTSDGTAAGTRLTRDICQGCSSWPSDPIAVGGQLFFAAADSRGRQVWRTTSATGADTVSVSDLLPANFQQRLPATGTDSRLFFAADDGLHGAELWISDGTMPGTQLLADLDAADQGGSAPSTFMTAAGTLFFFADDGVHGDELWRSDGTAAGTTLLHEFLPGPQARARFVTYAPAVETGGMLYAILELGGDRRALWRSDGTDAGTVRLTPEDVEVSQGGEHGGGPVLAGGKVYFTATDSLHGKELWVTDGAPAGTRMVAELEPGYYGEGPGALTAFQDKLFFSYEEKLWSSDGTEAGTKLVIEATVDPAALTVHQGSLYFVADAGELGRELWRSDGTEAGTMMAAELIPGPAAVDASRMTSLGSRLLLWRGGFAPELWVSDGTAAGSQRIASVRRMFSLTAGPEIGGILYFPGSDPSGGALWRTDGTEAGTFPLRDGSGRTIPIPVAQVAFDGRLFFISADVGATLWQTDGTPEGTVPLRELEPGKHSSLALAVAGSRLFFRAVDAATGSELWAIERSVP